MLVCDASKNEESRDGSIRSKMFERGEQRIVKVNTRVCRMRFFFFLFKLEEEADKNLLLALR
jgi:hypothetical protein